MELKTIFSILLILFQSTFLNCVELHCEQPIPSGCFISDQINAGGSDVTNVLFESLPEAVYRFEVEKSTVLTSIPQIIFEKFPNLGHVQLVENSVEVLTQESLSKATNLKFLNLSGNKLSVVRKSTFLNVPLLRKLDLSQNEIAEIENDAFDPLLGLTYLNMSGNKIKIIKRHALNGLVSLKRLDLSFNEIETIEEDALNVTGLREIALNNNKLKSISDTLFIDANHVEIIDLSNNQLNAFGRAFARLNDLFFLNLANNEKLENLTLMKFAHLLELRKLVLDNTGLKPDAQDEEDVPPEDPSKLIKLSLANNQLSNANLFKHLAIFPKLRGLYLQNNAFTHFEGLDEVKKTLPELRVLDLRNNKNTAIQEWVKVNENIFIEQKIEVEV